jgi:glyoxylase-like metal-dependent hydrolase (beta-lactamase superfamily II)
VNGWVREVRADNPSPMTLDGTRTYIVGNRTPVVIDPGPADAGHTARIVAELGGAAPLAILLSHAHPDHAGGVDDLAAATGSPVFVGGGWGTGKTGAEASPLEDGQTFRSDGGLVRAVSTPGHTPDHFAFHLEDRTTSGGGAVFVGDLLLGTGDTALVAWPEGNVASYIESLRRLERLRPEVLYPAHGPPITDPGDALGRYIRHRLERVEQVWRVLDASGVRTPSELVDEVYGSALDPRLRPAAEASIRALLEHLWRVGRAVAVDGARFATSRDHHVSEASQ